MREFPRVLAGLLDRLDAKGRFALLKLLERCLAGRRLGAPRQDRRSRQAFGRDVEEIEEVWHGIEPPYAELFAWLEGKGERPDPGSKATLQAGHARASDRGRGLARSCAARTSSPNGNGTASACSLRRKNGKVRLFSRAGDDISAAFPDIVQAFAHTDGVLDGELLVLRDGVVAPFNDLQQRLNRKTVTGKMLQDYPAHIRLYDLLFDGAEDIRTLSFIERRAKARALV